MPTRVVSNDLKARIPVLCYQHLYSVKEICNLLGLKKTCVYRSLKLYRDQGAPWNVRAQNLGRPRSLRPKDLKLISTLVRRRRCMYLDEIQAELWAKRGTAVSITTLSRALRRLNYTNKRVSARALERDDVRQAAYMFKIGDMVTNLDQLMFIDEAACNRKTFGRVKGWAPRGEKCVQRRFFVRGQRVSILPVLSVEGESCYLIAAALQIISLRLHRYHHTRYHSRFRHIVQIPQIPARTSDTAYQPLPRPPKHSRSRQLQYPPCRGSPGAGRR